MKDSRNNMLEKLLEERKEYVDKIRVLRDRLEEVKRKIAELNCPYKIGDMLTKDNEVVIIDKILPSYNPKTYHLLVRKIKKSGEPYKNQNTIYFPEQWHLLDVK